jgi:hypothetical protein
MLIALVAYDALPEPQRAALARLLESHPRYREDIAPALPAELSSDAERARWAFALASTWPDVARGQPEYDHGTWHYVNLPLELRRGELIRCREARRNLPASVRRLSELDAARRAAGQPGIPAGDSIEAALPKNLTTLADPAARGADRALSLSWVLHLVGDAHQPLHGVALFDQAHFVTGDRGGNGIALTGRQFLTGRSSLHGTWDDLLGADAAPGALASALTDLWGDSARARSARAAAQRLAVEGWIDEGCELARSAVYVPAILRAVSRFEAARDPATPAATGRPTGEGPAPPAKPGTSASASAASKPEVSLRDAYFEHARLKARERALAAGLRLAALLEPIAL